MVEQDEWRPFKAQPEPSLPVSPGVGTYHWGLQDTMEPSEAIGQRGKVATISYTSPTNNETSQDQGLKGMLF